jgi:GGDEF domain-containing protein
MRRKDILVSETDTRAWIVARDTGRIGAQALGARVVGAVRHADWWRGAPLTVSVGVAVLKEDGRDRAALIDAAEEARFAAAASGVGIIRAADEGDAPEPEA